MDRQTERQLLDRALALGNSGDGTALPELAGLLASRSADVRRLAASAIGKLAGVADAAVAVAALRPRLRDSHPQVRQYAAKALAAYGPAAAPARDELRAMAVAPGEKEYNRRAAALALAATGGSDTTDTTHRTNAAGAEVARAHGATPPPARAHASYASHPSYSPPPARALSAALAACPAAARARLVAALAEVARLAPAEAVEAIAAALREPASAASPGLIPPHGGYEALEAYRAAEIIHDATVVFCERFVNPRSRTHDQMVQAARSGKQNQVEGSVDSATSKKLELKLVGVARGSLEELLRDYTDYLRQHRLELWDKDDPRALAARRLAYEENRTYETYETSIRDGSAEVAANTIICLIHQASFLLDRQLQVLEQAFLRDGGFTERLYQARRSQRGDQPPRCERH